MMSMALRVLVLTSEWPSNQYPTSGVFVQRQVAALQSIGVQINVLPFRGHGNPLNYLGAFFRMNYELGRHKYDLIHAHFGQAGFLACLQNHCPTLITFHGSDLLGLNSSTWLGLVRERILQFVSLCAAKMADQVIVVSDELKRRMIWREAHVVPMGVDFSLFAQTSKEAARKSLAWSLQEKSVLFIGDPSNPIKRFELAQRAVGLVSDNFVETRLRTCTNVPIQIVPQYMSAADALIITSSHEGGPLVAWEALACNLPIVSVDVGSVRQRIEHLPGCVVCSDDSPETIARGLEYVLGYQGRPDLRVFATDFDERRIAQEIVKIYQHMLLKR